jgi:hypothetical protein
MPGRAQDIDVILKYIDYTVELVQRAKGPEEGSELVAEAVMLCAGKIQELTTPDSAHSLVVTRMIQEADLGSPETLRRIRGVLRAAAQLDGLKPQLHPQPQAGAGAQS